MAKLDLLTNSALKLFLVHMRMREYLSKSISIKGIRILCPLKIRRHINQHNNRFGQKTKKGGEQELDWVLFAPLGDAFSCSMLVRRFHDLRLFHQRLLKVGPLRGPEVTCESCELIW